MVYHAAYKYKSTVTKMITKDLLILFFIFYKDKGNQQRHLIKSDFLPLMDAKGIDYRKKLKFDTSSESLCKDYKKKRNFSLFELRSI